MTATATQGPRGRPDPRSRSGRPPGDHASPGTSPSPGAALAVLPRVLSRALAWTDAHRSHFTLPDDVLEPHTQVNATLKPLGELAQLGSTIRRATAPGTPEHELAGDLVTYAWQQVARGDLLLELLRAEPFAAYPYEIYAAFAGYGLRHEGFEALARPLTATRAWAHTEQHANRQLGLVNSERRVGVVTHTDAGGVLSRTWLGGLSEPWMFEGPSGYALTHTVFHLTDWGRMPDRVPERIDGYLRTWLPAWADGCLESGQWDLTGELLAVAAALPGPPPTALLDAVWPVLADVQHTSGCVPETGVPVREDAPPDPYPFIDCYHSTLVTAFAAALSLRSLRSPGPTRQTDEAGPGRERHTP
ncbi:hypothetical protein RI138_12150 [Streptomyces sp. C11-1]|uniref:DUF6895 domain-containing protein n=1 Tax=Streptomyces durocortorensis TaxID=2811104 RepID=A0ABY9W0I6_9ACTN|nr:hypothetical protein [Streptomyces durocortorensis]WNF27527.1 hypothetical protein RI138_12150 [Streptomyces durocortorensis]